MMMKVSNQAGTWQHSSEVLKMLVNNTSLYETERWGREGVGRGGRVWGGWEERRMGSNRRGRVTSGLRGRGWGWGGEQGNSIVSQTYSKSHSGRWQDVSFPQSGGLSVCSLLFFWGLSTQRRNSQLRTDVVSGRSAVSLP